MQTAFVLRELVIMAHVALDLLKIVLVRQVVHVDVRVAGCATLFAMYRNRVRAVVHKEGNGAAVHLLCESAVIMTHHALFVLLHGILLGQNRRTQQGQEHQQQQRGADSSHVHHSRLALFRRSTRVWRNARRLRAVPAVIGS
jgi:hypothetical protein